MDTLIFILELTGMPAFAISGAALGMRKGMDAFGVVMLGLITSVGGGVMRDVVLGITPPRTFSNPVYAPSSSPSSPSSWGGGTGWTWPGTRAGRWRCW